jgi:hypothetical protein
VKNPVEVAALPDSADCGLELPVAPDFKSRVVRIAPEIMLARIGQTMPWRSTRPGEQARRKEQGIAAEFVL